MIEDLGTEELAQLGKGIPSKHKDLSLLPESAHSKASLAQRCAYDPLCRVGRDGRGEWSSELSWGLQYLC